MQGGLHGHERVTRGVNGPLREEREVDFQECFRSKVSEREFTKRSREGGVKNNS